AILFDAGNTLIRMNFSVVAERLSELGVTVTADALVRAERHARVRLDGDLASAGQAPSDGRSTESRSTQDAYVRYVLEGVGVVDDGIATAIARWRREFNAPVGLWDLAEPNAEQALRLAREAGFKTAVISNSNGSIRAILKTLGLAPYLDLVIDSF